MDNADELRRLETGPEPNEKPRGITAEVVTECIDSATQTLQATREIWAIVLKQVDADRLSLEDWRQIFPSWFLQKFAPEIDMDEAVRRRALPIEERMRLAENWSLGAWVYWLKPSERHWTWWDAEITSPHTFHIKVAVDGLPFPSGSLEWLLKCCGARTAALLDGE